MKPTYIAVPVAAAAIAACSSSTSPAPSGLREADVVHRSDIAPVTRVQDAKPGVFIPGFVDCRAPVDGDTTSSAGGKVCTNVSIAGATEPGKRFDKYAACDVVRTQRPYYPSAPANKPDANDPRLRDAALVAEVEWARSQVASTGCVCCHDSSVAPKGASQWDIHAPGMWLDTVSNTGLALFAGLADSSVLGAYPAAENHGFDRTAVGVPSTDPERMRRLVAAELARRGVSEAQARAVPPFGGPIYEASVRQPVRCGPGEGVDPEGRVMFGTTGRYVFVREADSKNPGVPPNLDHPAGLLWKLDVLPSADPLDGGFLYGATPDGSFQDTPAAGLAPRLVRGRTYVLTVLRDVGLPTTNCSFVFGDAI